MDLEELPNTIIFEKLQDICQSFQEGIQRLRAVTNQDIIDFCSWYRSHYLLASCFVVSISNVYLHLQTPHDIRISSRYVVGNCRIVDKMREILKCMLNSAINAKSAIVCRACAHLRRPSLAPFLFFYDADADVCISEDLKIKTRMREVVIVRARARQYLAVVECYWILTVSLLWCCARCRTGLWSEGQSALAAMSNASN